MRSFSEWCQFFQDIEKNPRAIVPPLTVRDYLEAEQHMAKCKDCQDSSDRVLSQEPPETPFGKIGFN